MNGDEKIDNELNLALHLPEEEREKALDLNVGYEETTGLWEIIFQYAGQLEQIRFPEGVEIQPLSGGYAIAFLREELMESFSRVPQVIFVEKPKAILLEQNAGIAASCALSVKAPPLSLSGKGTIIAVIDTGIDIFHPDFLDEEGNTRIVALWDQSIPGNPPEPFRIGTVYDREEINRAIHSENEEAAILSRDVSGHGTHVASICAGREGMAPECELLVVKLGAASERGFPRTTQLMMAVQYVVDFAQKEGKPLAVNISYGHNYGDHRGTSLLETFLERLSDQWRNVICIGTGNEGDTGRHRHGKLDRLAEEVLFDIAPFEPNMNLQLWKDFADDFEITLISPSGIRHVILNQPGPSDYQYKGTRVFVYYGTPLPYNVRQEIYFSFVPQGTMIESGQWKLRFVPKNIVSGRYDMWLPVSAGTNSQTRFLEPSKTFTLTIPSTAYKIIAVGAYNLAYQSYAEFSGRGEEFLCPLKPDLTAPGVGIAAAAPGGGRNTMSGTSMATPFVTGASALLMQWGIIEGNDPYLYGERVRAYLHRGARRMEGFLEYPNNQVGYGRLCVRESLPDVLI